MEAGKKAFDAAMEELENLCNSHVGKDDPASIVRDYCNSCDAEIARLEAELERKDAALNSILVETQIVKPPRIDFIQDVINSVQSPIIPDPKAAISEALTKTNEKTDD